ncbi:MAG: DUF881 domain-containing protein [Clostridia bacterium]|nr:DUF881 domain-containing protein [Clostridia bacterium]
MKKIEKGKISLTISIGLTAFILILVMVTQFKTIEETDITGIEVMREAELRSELATWKTKFEEATAKIEETENKIIEYSQEIESNNNISELLQRELDEAKAYAGYTNVTGEGIIVTLTDTEKKQIEDLDLINLINELKIAGAEAISINDERIISTTDISNVNYRFIMVNTSKDIGRVRVQSPYIVKAIGNPKYLESAINIKYGFLDSMKSNEKSASYVIDNNITINKFDGSLEYKIATNVEE